MQRVAPDFVGAASASGRRTQSWFFSSLTGFTNPGIVGRYDFDVKETDKRWSIYRTTFVSGLNPNDFTAEQVRNTSAVPEYTMTRDNRSGTQARTVPAYRCSSCGTRTPRLTARRPRCNTVRCLPARTCTRYPANPCTRTRLRRLHHLD